MADLIYFHDDAAETLYAVIRALSGSFTYSDGTTEEAFNAAHWTTYAMALTKGGAATSGVAEYRATWPALLSGHLYRIVDVYVRGGVTPATTDRRIASFGVNYSTTDEVLFLGVEVSDVEFLAANATGAVNLKNAYKDGGTPPASSADVAAALTDVIGAKGGIPKLDTSTGLIVQGYGDGGVTLGTVTTLTNKTGFALASDGLDSVATTAPTGVASNFREMLVQVWRRFFKRATKTSTQIITYGDDDATPVTTQTISDDGTTQIQGPSA